MRGKRKCGACGKDDGTQSSRLRATRVSVGSQRPLFSQASYPELIQPLSALVILRPPRSSLKLPVTWPEMTPKVSCHCPAKCLSHALWWLPMVLMTTSTMQRVK
ncbi:hypothetical protein ElyMa_004630700 [Elysia marginata]|uniref:Uncharacterized protein n=1 Tax=Elysia marginata TaxID=1093978 RepID=A0AAV4I081_9GAST|nr:hypothetical protein ElyMa_004630700 [Elysia marginata]